MNIQYMRYFMTVAKLENVSRAAEVLHVSQSSLSKDIASLEKELGTPLFDRKGKKLLLNPVGVEFLESCRVIVAKADEALGNVQMMVTGRSNRIRISAAGINKKLFACMAEFEKRHPETSFEMDCIIDNDELPDINEYDVVIYPDELKFNKFKGYDFYKERYYLAVSANNPLTSKPNVPVHALDGLDYVFLRYENNLVEYPYRLCSALAVKMKACHFVDSRELHRQMIAAGLGVGFVPEGSMEMYVKNGEIRLLPLPNTRFDRPMRICFRREKHLTALGVAFRDHLISYFELEPRQTR